MNKNAKRLTKLLKSAGATVLKETPTDTVWELPNGEKWKVFHTIADRPARTVEKNIARSISASDGRGKRSGQAVKERQASEREQIAAEAERASIEYAEIVARREKFYQGMTPEQKRAEDDALEAAEREFRKWQKLMQQMPLPNVNRHRA